MWLNQNYKQKIGLFRILKGRDIRDVILENGGIKDNGVKRGIITGIIVWQIGVIGGIINDVIG